ncbi:tetratricopeptide repeat protein [Pectobacterium aroidearum]|uniref:tetratricopeptide repeat protein n=1 Tax=Pectobacterium aroidearum TaxID=1201031 RepID=UPI003158E9D3
MVEQEQKKQISPSEFMRQLRPEYYSDTTGHTIYQLDAGMLEYHLETITARNQMHDFEIFCRKLCERTICPNLKPATGPEGGGDSKADTETILVADEITMLTYIGVANKGQERWAFAFSAKKKWADKVRSDVAGIVATQRGYQKIYCVTSQFARAKDRARVEDDLSKQHGITITILDRTWIVEQIISADRRDLAFNYLGIGQEALDTRRLGPSDYSRTQQLEDIEKALSDPEAFVGMETQRVTEALVAAKLSRNLERPRTETDGRFARAIRLAVQDGTYRQQLETNYEWIWCTYWWFDDINQFNNSYSAFEQLVIDTSHAKNLELLCNLAQLLFNSVLHQHLTIDKVKLFDRIARLADKLESMASETERPNNALEARTSLLIIQVNQAMLGKNFQALNSLWLQFSEVVKQAKGLGEFSAKRLVEMIEVFGSIAGNAPSYAKLVDDIAAFVSERTGEAQGALVLLKRAQQLNFEDNFEMIRLLGKAVRQLSKKEYTEYLIEALQLLSLAYRSAGLLWAARANCIFAITSIVIEAEEDSDLPVSIVPTIMLLAWIAVELRHFPDMLEAIRWVRGCAATLPLDEASKERVEKRLREFDLICGSQILNFTLTEFQQVTRLPDILGRLGLYQSRNSLLYALGHEAFLREERSILEDETPEAVAELFTLLASQPVSSNLYSPVIFNESEQQCFVSRVQGMQVMVHHHCSETSILVAEVVIGSIEVLFATTLELNVAAHTENFTITIQENADILKPDFKVKPEEMTATVHWPAGLHPATYGKQDEIQKTLTSLSVMIFVATCYAQNPQQIVEHLIESEAVIDRITMLVAAGNGYRRIFNKSVLRLSDWTQMDEVTTFPLELTHPIINRRALEPVNNDEKNDIAADKLNFTSRSNDHRNLSVRSVIDLHLWDQAGWKGVAFADCGAPYPPVIALMFTDKDVARKIFMRWRERFGSVDKQEEIYFAIVRGISVKHPVHYRVLITSQMQTEDIEASDKLLMVPSRIQTMEPQSDANLRRFLDTYQQTRAYLLAPAILQEQGSPEFLMDIAILKRKLSVKTASEVNENDLEMIALRVSHDAESS